MVRCRQRTEVAGRLREQAGPAASGIVPGGAAIRNRIVGVLLSL
jgi:hypothetical protein